MTPRQGKASPGGSAVASRTRAALQRRRDAIIANRPSIMENPRHIALFPASMNGSRSISPIVGTIDAEPLVGAEPLDAEDLNGDVDKSVIELDDDEASHRGALEDL
jgi:hypothetical protein